MTFSQLDMFPQMPAVERARKLRDRGIRKAADHAGDKWNDLAYRHLLKFVESLPRHRRFMTEQVRTYAYSHGFAPPPSERAWGSVILRAVKASLVVSCGYSKVSNQKAHCANAAVWRKI